MGKKKQDKTFMNLITRRLVEFWCPIFKVNVLSSFSICCFGSYVIDRRLLFYFSFKFLSENKVKTNSKQITFYPMQSVNWCNKRLIKYLENTQHTKMRLGTLRVLKTGNSQIKPLLIINWTEFNSSYTFFFPQQYCDSGKRDHATIKRKVKIKPECLGSIRKFGNTEENKYQELMKDMK